MSSPTPHILFAEPPPDQAEGGIDLAMQTIETYLDRIEVPVTRRASLDDVRRANTPRIVHFHGLWQLGHSWMSRWCRAEGVPYVISPHGMLEPWAWSHKKWKKWPYYHLVERVHLQGAEHVLATSELEAENLSDFVSAELVTTIPLALPEEVGPNYEQARAKRGWQPEESVLVYLSRLHEKKGMHMLLESLAALPAEHKRGLRLVVVGDGPSDYEDRLRELEAHYSEQLPSIDWEGAVWGPEKWTYLQGADLFCLPTHSENFGLVVLEACQVGTPVLTTTGTPWRFLEDWNSGLIAEPTPASIQSALERYCSSFTWTREDRDRLVQRTRDRFGLSSIGQQYASLYGELVDRNGLTGDA
jgi:glycosyltransferase involved in cell wall biosynthesis